MTSRQQPDSHNRALSRRQQRRERHRQRPRWLRWLIRCTQLLLVLLICAVAAGGGLYWYYSRDLPSIEALGTHRPFETTKIYARDGTTLLYELFDADVGKRTVVPFSNFPADLKNATIAIEDANFYTNPGVNFTSIVRAYWANVTNQPTGQGGASTITQQLVRNVLLSPEERTEYSLRRKIREAILAYQISQRYSKDQILALYLNEIPYGNNAYGAEAAAQAYFGVPVQDLSLAQASLLAGLPQAPSQLDPLTNPQGAKERQRQVLNAMVRNNFISAEQARTAFAEPLYVQPAVVNLRAPHFVFYIRDQLEAKYGPELLHRGGLRVITTLDPHWQDVAQATVAQRIDEIRSQHASNGAVVMLDRETNQVLAMVGSADYNDASIDGKVNVALAERQPGSALKPFVYATAMLQGWYPATVLWDVPTEYPLAGDEVYAPNNYDGAFHGPVSIRQALANSFNIPAVKTLDYVGIDRFLQQVHSMGITTLNDRPRYGLSLALGGGEVKLIDLTTAYSVFANGGNYRPPTTILRVENTRGEVLESWSPPQPQPVLGPNGAGIAYMISDILSDNQTREWMFGPDSALELPDGRPAAVKTGTTDDDRDSWAVGYTPQVVIGAWVGNSDNAPMDAVPGSFGAAVIWQRLMLAYHEGIPATPFERPDSVVEHEVCALSGMLPTPACPQVRTDLFLQDQLPSASDTMFVMVRVGPSGDCVAQPTQPGSEQPFVKLPPEAQGWTGSVGGLGPPPNRPCALAVGTGTTSPSPVAISEPSNGSIVGPVVRIRGSAESAYTLSWGAGSAPTTWQTILTDSGGVSNGLLGIWNADQPEGQYTIKLVVYRPSGPEEQWVTVNLDRTPPKVELIVPSSGSINQALRLQAVPSDANPIARVEWEINAETQTRASPPWELDWTPLLPGTYRVRASAYDSAGNRGQSSAATIVIRQ